MICHSKAKHVQQYKAKYETGDNKAGDRLWKRID
jgi:hypothetical protein